MSSCCETETFVQKFLLVFVRCGSVEYRPNFTARSLDKIRLAYVKCTWDTVNFSAMLLLCWLTWTCKIWYYDWQVWAWLSTPELPLCQWHCRALCAAAFFCDQHSYCSINFTYTLFIYL